jgi:hypothetical protein
MVQWDEAALERLADFYVREPSAAERDVIFQCVLRINRRLETEPWSPGEDRGPNRRVWFTPPLMVTYYLRPGGGVLVYHVNRVKGDVEDE